MVVSLFKTNVSTERSILFKYSMFARIFKRNLCYVRSMPTTEEAYICTRIFKRNLFLSKQANMYSKMKTYLLLFVLKPTCTKEDVSYLEFVLL